MKLKKKNQIILRSLFNRYYQRSLIIRQKSEFKSINHFPSYLRKYQQNNQLSSVKIINSPKISIVIPCFNEARTILPIIQSIKNIYIHNYEIIIVDDGSTDHSVEMIRRFKNIKCGFI